MRLILTSLAAMLVALPVAACSVSVGADDDKTPGIAASGTGGERHYAVSGFDKVALGGAGDVEVRTGQSFCHPSKISIRNYPVEVADGAQVAQGPYQAETIPVTVEQQDVIVEM